MPRIRTLLSVAWTGVTCCPGLVAALAGAQSNAAAAPPSSTTGCAPRLTQVHWLAAPGTGSSQLQVAWQWSPPRSAGATLRVLVTDQANPDPATNQALDPRALLASAGTGDTLNWYPTTAHTAALIVSQPAGPCDGTASADSPVTFADAPPIPAPTASPVSQPLATPESLGPQGSPTSASAGTGGGGACLGPLCTPTLPDLGQALSDAIVSGLTTLLTNAITALSSLLQSIITWATAGSTCTTTSTGSSPFTLLSGTPPCLSWTNPYVQTYATLCRTIALSLIALLICLHGLEIALATRAGHTFEGPLDALRRVALAAVLGSVLVGSNGGDGLVGALLTLTNAMTAAVGGGPLPAAPGGGVGAALQDALVGLLYLVMELVLIVQLLLRLALLDLLLVIAPLAVLCYAYPRWAHWATHWAQLTAATVLLQFLQVLALQVSARMVASLDVSSAGAANASILQTLLGIAGLVLVVRLPRLLYGLSSGVLGGGLPIALGWGAGQAASAASGGGTTTVTPDESQSHLGAGGSAGSAPALPPAGGSQGGGPLYPGGSGGGSDLTPSTGAGMASPTSWGGPAPTGEGDTPGSGVTITEVAPPSLEGPTLPLLPSAEGTEETPPPGGWP